MKKDKRGQPDKFFRVRHRINLTSRTGLATYAQISFGQTTMETVQMNYPNGMDHLDALREKVGHLREEIAQIQELNKQHRLQGNKSPEAHLAHIQRQERLHAIQQELAQLASLGPKVLSVEEMKERHLSRLHLVKRAS